MVGLFGSCILYEIKEEDAEGNVAYIYSDLRKSLNIEVVNTIWRYLATIDGGLEWVWSSSKKLYMSGKLETVKPHIEESIQFQNFPQIPDNILKSIGIYREEKLQIIKTIEKYNVGNSKNLIGLSSFLRAYDPKIFLKDNILLKSKITQNDVSNSISKETFETINSLSAMFINTNKYIPFPPGLYVELSKWPSFLSLIWGMFAGLEKNIFQKNISLLNKKTEVIIEPLFNDINIVKKPYNNIEINIPVHNLVTVVIPKMLLVGIMLKKSLS